MVFYASPQPPRGQHRHDPQQTPVILIELQDLAQQRSHRCFAGTLSGGYSAEDCSLPRNLLGDCRKALTYWSTL